MLDLCQKLGIKSLLIPELSEVYTGFQLRKSTQILLNYSRLFIDELKESKVKIQFKKIITVTSNEKRFEEFQRALLDFD